MSDSTLLMHLLSLPPLFHLFLLFTATCGLHVVARHPETQLTILGASCNRTDWTFHPYQGANDLHV